MFTCDLIAKEAARVARGILWWLVSEFPYRQGYDKKNTEINSSSIFMEFVRADKLSPNILCVRENGSQYILTLTHLKVPEMSSVVDASAICTKVK